MSRPRALLEVQELDLAADRLRNERAKLPQRAALTAQEEAIAAHERVRDEAAAAHEALARDERNVAEEVASLAARAQQVDDAMYSGTVTVAKELGGLQQELAMWRQKQEVAEERELELLEAIEASDAGLAELATRRASLDREADALRAAIAAAEAEIDARIGELEREVAGRREDVPPALLAVYDRLRTGARLGGRAAVLLESRMCGGCRVDLPMMEYQRVKDAAEDAVVQCVHCTRLLVR